MRKSVIIAALTLVGVFAGGYVVGQATGITSSSAANSRNHEWRGFGTDRGFSRELDTGRTDKPHADGTVTAVSGNTISVKADADTGQTGECSAVTGIDVSTGTQYSTGADDGASTAGESSVKVGSYVLAEGTLSSDGKTLTATTVRILHESGNSDSHNFLLSVR